MDLGEWLRSLGLERYEPAFRENDIDDAILPRLTAEDNKTRFSGTDLGSKPNVLLFDLAQCASIMLILTTQ